MKKDYWDNWRRTYGGPSELTKTQAMKASERAMSMTLRELKPRTGINVTVEYRGRRYLLTHCNNWFSAERVACDYQAMFPNACYFTSDKYDSTHIDGNAKDFRKHYKGESER